MKRTVLVVDDESSISENIAFGLKQDGFDCRVVTTGQDAEVALAAESIDLVVLDVGLPDIDGFEVARRIRKHSNVPIIFLTARASEIDRVVGLELGADDYVVKPFSVRELLARVRAILRRSNGAPAVKLGTKPATFEIDDSRCEIRYQGSALQLSRYEFLLLKVLVKSPGRVYSREHLMQLVWEEPEMSLERTVDSHIKAIRHKLKKVTPQIDPIETHRGFGYSLREGL